MLHDVIKLILGREPDWHQEVIVSTWADGTVTLDEWNAPEPRPSEAEIEAAKAILAAKPSDNHCWDGQAWVLDTEKGWRIFRDEIRPPLMVEADHLVNLYLDKGMNASNARAYRQALRDIPETQGDPFDIVLPVKPPRP